MHLESIRIKTILCDWLRKTNIGHLDNVSGISGFIKLLLSLKNKKIPRSLHFKRPNRNINFLESPIYVNNRLSSWPSSESLRRCGINSFGLSGTNCHIVLEEAPPSEGRTGKSDIQLLALSAQTESSLQEVIKSYINFWHRAMTSTYSMKLVIQQTLEEDILVID